MLGWTGNHHLIEDNLHTSAALHNRKLDPLGTKVDTKHILCHRRTDTRQCHQSQQCARRPEPLFRNVHHQSQFFSVARMFQATHARALTNGAATASDAASFCSCTCSFGNRTLAMSTLQFSRKGGAIPFYIGLLNHCRNHLSERLNISRVRLFATDCTSARLTGMQMSAFICDLHSAHLL